MRTRHLPILLAFFSVPVLAQPPAAQTADEIVEKHLAAMGGREALGKLTSRRSTGSITVTTPNGDLSGPFEAVSKAPNKGRVYFKLDLSALGAPEPMILEQKFDGVAGITLNSIQGDTEITGTQLENMKNNVFPTPLLAYKAAGVKVEVLKEQLAGKNAIVLLVTPKAGSVIRLYLDAETHLIVRSVAKFTPPQASGEVEQVVEPSDYRTVDGVKVPFQIVNSMPMQSFTVKLEKVEHNVALDDALFAVKR
jgi:hypothetical protein